MAERVQVWIAAGGNFLGGCRCRNRAYFYGVDLRMIVKIQSEGRIFDVAEQDLPHLSHST